MKTTILRMSSAVLLSGVGLLGLVGCGVPDESGEDIDTQPVDATDADESVSRSSEAIRGPIGPIGPRPCGSNTCGSGTFCCNASCGTCAPLGGACTQQVCASAE